MYTRGLEMGLAISLNIIFQKWVAGAGYNVFRDAETYVVCAVDR